MRRSSDTRLVGIESMLTELSSGVFTVASVGQTILNIGSAVTAGKNLEFPITGRDWSFIDDSGASTIIGEQFGVTTGVAWGSPRPFFIYACMEDSDADVSVAISPNSCATVVPATANIGWNSNPMATPSDNGFFFLDDTDPSTLYDGNPCVKIGALNMVMSAADDHTVQALATVPSGIGQDKLDAHHAAVWTFPLNQNGAEAGKHFTSTDGATALEFTGTNTCYFMVHPDGRSTTTHVHETQSTNGADGTAVRWMLPYAINATMNTYGAGEGKIADTFSVFIPLAEVGVSYVTLAAVNQAYNSGAMLDNQFTHTNDYANFTITFKAF